jgi:hypothetical protein
MSIRHAWIHLLGGLTPPSFRSLQYVNLLIWISQLYGY